MLGNNFYYDGQQISNQTVDYYVGIETVKRLEVQSQDTKVNIGGYHGVKASPTYLRGRFITIEGGIDCDSRAKSVDGMNYLRQLFSLPPITGSSTPTKVFKIVDENGDARNMNVKIDKPLVIEEGEDDHLEGTVRRWRVVLFAEDARMLSDVSHSVPGEEGNYGGFIMGAELFDQRNYVYKKITCVSVGSTQSPAKITLTAVANINTKLKILNLTNLSSFEMDINAVATDVIVIDSYNNKITKNGNDVTATRLPGSVRPSVFGTTDFVMYDQDGGLVFSDFNVTVEFYDIII